MLPLETPSLALAPLSVSPIPALSTLPSSLILLSPLYLGSPNWVPDLWFPHHSKAHSGLSLSDDR